MGRPGAKARTDGPRNSRDRKALLETALRRFALESIAATAAEEIVSSLRGSYLAIVNQIPSLIDPAIYCIANDLTSAGTGGSSVAERLERDLQEVELCGRLEVGRLRRKELNAPIIAVALAFFLVPATGPPISLPNRVPPCVIAFGPQTLSQDESEIVLNDRHFALKCIWFVVHLAGSPSP